MLADDDTHRAGRKATVATFNSQVVDQHEAMIGGAARRALATWPADVAVPLHDHLRALTLEVILRTLAGNLHDALDPTLALLHRRTLEMLTITANPMFVESRLRHGPGKIAWNRFQDRRRQVDELLSTLIKSHALRSLRGNAVGHGDASLARDDLMSLILARHETTAAQLAWAFQLLAHHPAVRDRLVREIDSEAGDEYLTATVQEVLRHRCVFVFAIPRAVAKPVEVDGRTYTPPANLLACIYLLHHDPAIYPDPDSFRPERFLETPPDPSTWMPWGGGRKRCPGRHLAMLEMKVVLRTVLRERMPEAAARRMERPRWRSVIVAPRWVAGRACQAALVLAVPATQDRNDNGDGSLDASLGRRQAGGHSSRRGSGRNAGPHNLSLPDVGLADERFRAVVPWERCQRERSRMSR